MKITEARILVIDTETTGVDPLTSRVVAIGGAEILGGQPGKTFRRLINPGCPIPERVSLINGVYDADVAGAATFAEAAPIMAQRLLGYDCLAGYNAVHFDGPLLNEEFARVPGCGAHQIATGRILDPFLWMRACHPDKARSLAAACDLYGFKIEQAHTAVADARAAGELLLAFVAAGRVPDSLEYALGWQEGWAHTVAQERADWGCMVYRDDGRLFMGVGRHRGKALRSVPRDWLEYMLRPDSDLHPGARELFQDVMDGRVT